MRPLAESYVFASHSHANEAVINKQISNFLTSTNKTQKQRYYREPITASRR